MMPEYAKRPLIGPVIVVGICGEGKSPNLAQTGFNTTRHRRITLYIMIQALASRDTFKPSRSLSNVVRLRAKWLLKNLRR